MKNSWFGIRIVILLIVIAIASYYKILSTVGVDLDTIFSTIALTLFIGMMAYYLLPRPMGRRHRNVISTHKQYNDSRLTDLMMEKIMKAYNVKEEAGETEDDNDVYESTKSEFDNTNFQRRSGKEIVMTAEEQIDKVASEEVESDEEIAVEVKHKQYNDSRLTDYMMEKIMKAYNVPEEPESDDEEESDFDEFEEDEPSPVWSDQQPQFDSYEVEDAEARSKFFEMLSKVLEIIGFLWLCGIVFAEENFPSAKSILADKTLLILIIKVFPALLLIVAIIARILGIKSKPPGDRALAIFRGVFLLLLGIGYVINQLSGFLSISK